MSPRLCLVPSKSSAGAGRASRRGGRGTSQTNDPVSVRINNLRSSSACELPRRINDNMAMLGGLAALPANSHTESTMTWQCWEGAAALPANSHTESTMTWQCREGCGFACELPHRVNDDIALLGGLRLCLRTLTLTMSLSISLSPKPCKNLLHTFAPDTGGTPFPSEPFLRSLFSCVHL